MLKVLVAKCFDARINCEFSSALTSAFYTSEHQQFRIIPPAGHDDSIREMKRSARSALPPGYYTIIVNA